MRIFSVVGREILLSFSTLVMGTLVVYAIAFYATGSIQKKQLGLDPDKGAIGAYVLWCADVIHGDLSGDQQSPEVFFNQVRTAFGNTILLVSLAMLLSFAGGLLIAWYLVSREGGFFSRSIHIVISLSGAIPVFLIAILIYTFFESENAKLIQVSPLNSFWENLLPFVVAGVVLSFGSGVLGEIVRVFKTELGKVTNESFIHAARARGAIVWKHIAKASIVPVASTMISKIPFFVGAAIIVEKVFAINGLGSLMEASVKNANFSKLMYVAFIMLLVVIAGRIFNTVLVAIVDPRVR